jgi:hypothetical protein
MKRLMIIASIVGILIFSVGTSVFASGTAHFDYLFSDNDTDKNFLGSVDYNFPSLPNTKFCFDILLITVKIKTAVILH